MRTLEPPDFAIATHRKLATTTCNGPAWWFLGGLAVLRNPPSAPRTPVMIEMHFPPLGASPLHTHAELDDTFHVLEGELVVRYGDDMLVARAGDVVTLPHGVPFTHLVTSDEGARVLLVHTEDSFLSLIEALGTPTNDLRLPKEGEFNADPDTVMRMCEEYKTPVMGPPLREDEARNFLLKLTGGA